MGHTTTLASLRIVEVDFRNDSRWDSFVASHPDGLIYHHSTWLRVLEAENHLSPVTLGCETDDGELSGILALSYTRGMPFRKTGSLTGRRLSSLPRTPIAGPLAVDDLTCQTLLRAAIERVRRDPTATLQIKVLGRSLDRLSKELVAEPWRPNFLVRLAPDPGDILLGNSKRKRASIMQAVRRAARLGVRVREADTESDLHEWYRLYLHTMRAAPIPPRPYRLFTEMWRTLRPHGFMQLLLGEVNGRNGTKLIAGTLVLRFGSTVVFAFNGRLREYSSLRPGEAIHWKVIEDACRDGFQWYDFGEAEVGGGLAAFKAKWATDTETLYRYYFPPPRERGSTNPDGVAADLVRVLWQRLPLRTTARLGDWIYHYL
jgi:CelD/BcsL family acetyltransferase involved in cellulose biosynthesis